jgi:hypothetical protein
MRFETSHPVRLMPTLRSMLFRPLGVPFLTIGMVYGCTPITSVPVTITTSGVYCLTGNLTLAAPSAPAITVSANSVVIDFHGYRLNSGTTAPLSGVGIRVDTPHATVRNGHIVGFSVGVFSFAKATIVEDMRLSNNHQSGVDSEGLDTVVRRNVCVLNELANCIRIGAGGSRVVDNDIAGVPEGGGTGIFISGLNAFVVGNRLTRLSVGIQFGAYGSGKYRDNLTSNVREPFVTGGGAGIDVGNNH